MGPERKLRSYEALLLSLIELKLAFLNRELSDRFSISESLCSNFSHCWLRAIALYLQYFVYMPGIEMINVTSPKRFHQYRNPIGITGCGEVFIETPKDLELLSATWSEYEHHNIVKYLMCIAPNSGFSFVSKAFIGRISDKK